MTQITIPLEMLLGIGGILKDRSCGIKWCPVLGTAE